MNHMHPVALFVWHMLHNFLLTHRAEWIAPEYIKLWLRGLPQVSVLQVLACYFARHEYVAACSTGHTPTS